jgi:hypothetical protein
MMELLGGVGHVESRFDLFGDGVSVGADWCTVYAKRTTGLEIILDALDRTARRRGSCGISFRSIWR